MASNFSYKPISCISLYGLETNLRNTVCSWKHPGPYYIEKVYELGFDTIRIPISIQYVFSHDYTVLDSLFAKCEELKMRVLLDFHRVSNNRQEETWDKGIEENGFVNNPDEMLNMMLAIISRYSDSPALMGMNSWNEVSFIIQPTHRRGSVIPIYLLLSHMYPKANKPLPPFRLGDFWKPRSSLADQPVPVVDRRRYNSKIGFGVVEGVSVYMVHLALVTPIMKRCNVARRPRILPAT